MDSETLDRALMIAGAVVPLLSAVASLLNHVIRKRVAAEQKVSPFLSGVGTVINLAAMNLDKVVQLVKQARGKPTPMLPEPKTPVVPAPPAVPPVVPPVAKL